MKLFSTSVVAVAVFSGGLTGMTQAQEAQKVDRARTMAGLINVFRSQNQLRPLRTSKELNDIAEECAALMSEKEVAAADETIRRVVRKTNSTASIVVFALDPRQSSGRKVEDWISRRDRAVLIDRNFRGMGIGVAIGKSGKSYYCVILGR